MGTAAPSTGGGDAAAVAAAAAAAAAAAVFSAAFRFFVFAFSSASFLKAARINHVLWK